MKRLLSAMLIAAAVVGMVALSSPAEAEQLRIGAHRALMGSFEVIAHRLGYWKDEGLDYTFQYFKQGKLMRNAIIQGNLDTGTTGFSPFTTAVSKGAQVTAIGVTANICHTQHIVIPVDSKITSIKEFKGTIFANKKGTSTDFAFQSYVLPHYGLQSSDVQLLSVNATDRIAAVVSGSAQAAMVGDPQAEIAMQKGLVKSMETLCEYDKTRMMHIGNPQTLKAHPELYEKYFKGWLKAHKLLQEDPEQYAKVYTEALQEVGDKAEYDVILPVVKRLRTELYISDEVKSYLNDMAEKQSQLGWIKSHPDFTKSEALDDSILRKIAKEMGWEAPSN